SRVTYGDGTFIATTTGPGASILTSRDGVVWTKRTPPSVGWLNAVAYAKGTFVVVGERGIVLTSPDGVDWTQRVSATLDWLVDVTYGNGTFLALTEGVQPGILTSSDEVTWTLRDPGLGPLPPLLAAAYGAGLFVAVGGLSGGVNPILTSPDGEKWT